MKNLFSLAGLYFALHFCFSTRSSIGTNETNADSKIRRRTFGENKRHHIHLNMPVEFYLYLSAFSKKQRSKFRKNQMNSVMFKKLSFSEFLDLSLFIPLTAALDF